MTIPKTLLSILALASLALAEGDTFATKFNALPKSVQETAKKHMENAFPVSIAAAKGAQGWDYQINTRVDGKYHDLVIDEKGQLVAIKDETELAALPAAAKAAIEKQTSSAKLVTLEKVTEGPRVSYGAVIRDAAQGTITQIRVDADGTVKPKKP